MPKYRNDTSGRLVVDGQTLEVGETITTLGWYTIAGLTKLDDLPTYDPTILSAVVTVSGTVFIPATANGMDVTRYTIKIRGMTGATGETVAFNDAGVTPALDVEAGDEYEISCNGRTITELAITINVGPVKVDVFRW